MEDELEVCQEEQKWMRAFLEKLNEHGERFIEGLKQMENVDAQEG